jgi:hypothetical protein
VSGWLNIGKRTPFVVVGTRRTVAFPFNALRQTVEGWEFDVVVDNERYVGTVDGRCRPVLNGLVYFLTATVTGDWIPKSNHYIQHGEMEYEDFWLLEHGSLKFDEKRLAETVAFADGWGDLPEVETIAGLQAFYGNLGMRFDADTIVNRILWRNAFERSVVEHLLRLSAPPTVAYSLSDGLWRFFVKGCTITTRACIGSSVLVEHPELGNYEFKITNDRDAFVTFVDSVCIIPDA